jgi:hypothetical protein
MTTTSLFPVSERWVFHLTSKEDKDKAKRTVANSGFTIALLKNVVSHMLQTSTRVTTKRDAYDTPSWAYKQAHENGYQQALKEVLELTKHLDNKE